MVLGVGLWKDIRIWWDDFSLRTSILLKNGLGTKFYLDR